MRVLVAGASGVIGRRLVRLLAAAGHVMTGTTRSPERA
ncbi:MAG TPA: NAD-dependent epimerase/dehydratase family protein, partial [Methylomirabilota bacterium]